MMTETCIYKNKKCKLKITKKGIIKLKTKRKTKVIGDESILQSSIDSKCNIDYFPCKCKKDNAFLVSSYKSTNKYYYCLTCGTLYKKRCI